MLFKFLIPLLAAIAFANAANAETRTVELEVGGVTALADLVTPDDQALKKGVVLITHGTLAHKDMEIVEALQTALAERGIASLAHTLTLGIDRREGMYDCNTAHRHAVEDAIDEIEAWVAWLKKQGAGPVTVLGHSRGGNQVAWYGAERAGDQISRIVLLAPTTGETREKQEGSYKERYKADLADVLQQANALASAGKAKDMMDVPGLVYCPNVKAQARSVISYHGDEPRRDTPSLIPALKVPVLVIAASEDAIVTDVAERVKPLADEGKVTLEVVDGADHFFLDFYAEDAADLIAKFVKTGS